MSDTPRTTKAKIACGFQAVPQSFLEHAENLERENDKLWKSNHRHQSMLHDLRSTLEVLPLESSVQTAQRLKRENAALRELAARMATEMREVDHEFCSLVDYDNLQSKI